MDINWSPDRGTLRRFGFISIFGFGIPAGVVMWVWHMPTLAGVLAVLGALTCISGFVCPPAARCVFVGLSLIGYPIGLAVSHVILAVVYFAMFTPIALVFKILGRDALQRRLAPKNNSYWQVRPTSTDPAAYYRQF